MYDYDLIKDYYQKELFTMDDLMLLVEVGSIPEDYIINITNEIDNVVVK